jgi:nucleoside-diphosphate-sugar epimerase
LVARSERVLLTGAGGFTGRPLAARLRQDGHQVFGVTRPPAGDGEIEGDLRDYGWIHSTVSEIRPTIVIHLAGIATPLHGNIGEIYTVNVAGTANLLSVLAELKERPTRVIVASSAAVYGLPEDDRPIAESASLRPLNHYGVSKRAMEDMVDLYAGRLPIVVTRPFNYTGPGQNSTHYLVPKIVDHFARRAPHIKLGNLDLHRDFSDIRWIVEVYAQLVSRAVEPTTLNVCSGRLIHLAGIIATMREISGHTIDVIRDPALLRAGEPPAVRGSVARLHAVLGKWPNPDFRDTLQSMYDAALALTPR